MCKISLLVVVHLCPAVPTQAKGTARTTKSKSASSATMMALLPPNSKSNFPNLFCTSTPTYNEKLFGIPHGMNEIIVEQNCYRALLRHSKLSCNKSGVTFYSILNIRKLHFTLLNETDFRYTTLNKARQPTTLNITSVLPQIHKFDWLE